MEPTQTPYPTGWPSIELPGHRENLGTYAVFSYESLPPLHRELCRGDFQWLKQSAEHAPPPHNPEISISQIADIIASASELGLTLPPEFIRFMESANLRNRVRSCTDCYFELPDWIAACPRGGEGFLVRFLSDSQGCVFWYLYFTKAGEHCVIASDELYGSKWEDEDLEEEEHFVVFCAPSFEEFIFRFWIENEIWYVLYGHENLLTKEQQAYLDHYGKGVVPT